LTTTFSGQKLPFAEGTIVDAFMTRKAIVAAYVQTALYADKLAGATLRPAGLDAGSKIYYSAVKRSAQLFNAGIPSLEPLYIRLQPLIDMVRTQIDEVGQILYEIRSPFRVIDVLPRSYLVPGLAESPKTRVAVCIWSIWSCQ
jgi:hypothetical protein